VLPPDVVLDHRRMLDAHHQLAPVRHHPKQVVGVAAAQALADGDRFEPVDVAQQRAVEGVAGYEPISIIFGIWPLSPGIVSSGIASGATSRSTPSASRIAAVP
jgi:hypothetical protein